MVGKILALLEHPEVMNVIATSLEQFGHEVVKANNFHDAMDANLGNAQTRRLVDSGGRLRGEQQGSEAHRLSEPFQVMPK